MKVKVNDENSVTLPLASEAPLPSTADEIEVSGGVVSWTVTLKVAEPELPRVSAALQVTVVVPMGKVDPEGGLQVTGREPSTTSVAEAPA